MDKTEATAEAMAPFPSLPVLRARHAELSGRYRTAAARDDPIFWDEVERFLRQARATGARLESADDREAAQAILNVWSSNLYRARRGDVDAELAEYDPGAPHDLSDDEYPYVGLSAIDEPRARAFCGRELLVHDWAKRLRQQRLLVVVGPPFSGKTSLVMAGLIPELKSGRVVPGSEGWRYPPPITPDSDPLARLAGLFRPTGVDEPDWDAHQAALLRGDPGRVVRLAAESGDGPLLLVVDGFDQVLKTSAEDDRRAFAACLAALVTAAPPEPRHTVILLVHDTEAGRLEQAGPLRDLIEPARVTITPPGAGELREAITRPAAAAGLRFEEGVVDALVHDLVGDPFALPLLQFTLQKLWRERQRDLITWDAYRRVGGGRLAVRRAADAFYQGLSSDEQRAAREILMQLVRPGADCEASLETVPRDILLEALARVGVPRGRADDTVRKLVDAGLVRELAGPRGPSLALPHVVLMQCWPTLISWLNERRQEQEDRGRLTVAARHWEETGRRDDALWRGAPLDEALGYTDLSDLEEAFIKAALAARSRSERVKRRYLWSVVIVLTAVVGVAVYQWLKAEHNANIASIRHIAARVDSVRRNDWALLLATTAYKKAKNLGQSGDPARVFPEVRRALFSALSRSPQLDRYVFTGPDKMPVLVVALSPNGRLLATVTRSERSNAAAKGGENMDCDVIRLWHVGDRDREEPKPLAELKKHRGRVFSLAFSPDGTRLASGGGVPPYPESGEILLWDLNDPSHPRWIATLDCDTVPGEPRRLNSPVVQLAFHPRDSAILAFATMAIYQPTSESPYYLWKPGQVELWDITTPSPVGQSGPGHMLSSTETMTLGLAFNPDGSRLVTGGGFDPDNTGYCTQGEVVLWDVAAFPNKRVWNPERLRLGSPRPTDSLSAAVSELTFAPGRDGRLIAAGTIGGSILLIDAVSGKTTKELLGHQGPVMSLAFFPDEPGKGTGTLTLASGSNDAGVRLWEVPEDVTKARDIGQPMTAHVGGVQALVFEQPHGTRLLSAGSDETVIRWNVTTRDPLSRALGRTGGQPQAVDYSPDGIVATAGTDLAGTGPGGIIGRLWEGSVAPMTSDRTDGHEPLEILQPLTGLEGRGAPVLGLAFGSGGQLLVGGDLAGNVLFWDMAEARDPEANRRPISVAYSEKAHVGPVNDVVSHPTRPIVASCGDDTQVVLWDVSDPARIHRLPKPLQHSGYVQTAAFCPAGNLLATAAWLRTIYLWDLSNPNSPVNVGELRGHAGGVLALDFSPDGKLLVSGGMDATVFLWDVEKGEHGPPLRLHRRPVLDVKFSPVFRWQPFCRWLVSASEGEEETNLLLWNVPESVKEAPVPSPLKGHVGGVSKIAFRYGYLNERGILRLASVGRDSTLQLWDIGGAAWLDAARQAAGRDHLDPGEWEALVPGSRDEALATESQAP